MIDYLKGVLVKKSPTKLVVEVNGIGFGVNITLPCYESLGEIGEHTELITYLHVREDILQLYGFSSVNERDLFLDLISAPGIGPKKAQAILSSVSVEHLQQYILEEDLTGLTSLSGVGKKTAQRLILDLKDKVKTKQVEAVGSAGVKVDVSERDHIINEAISALTSLGFNKNRAEIVVHKIARQNEKDLTLEDLIKQALQLI